MQSKRRKQKTENKVESLNYVFVEELKDIPISSSLKENKNIIETMFQDCSDFVIRHFEIEKSNTPAIAIMVDGLVNTQLCNEALKDLMILEGGTSQIESLHEHSMAVSQTQIVDNYGQLIVSVLSGDVGILLDHNDQAVLLGLRFAQTRSVAEPETEAVVRGPREGFIENIRTNTALLRRKLKTPHLKMKPMILGKHSNTNIVISYLEGIADQKTVKEVIDRIEKIHIDAVLESGYIEEFIQDSVYSPFPQVQYTERPDTVAASLLQGRIAIFVDGTPFVLVVPVVFWQLMQANEDYYERFQVATLIRWLRYLFLFVSLLTPGFYVAVITYHYELIPTQLLLSIAAAREAIPFPAIVEALIMEITFEALREAGVRLPKTIGQAVSIVGALVVGQAAVQAGIVSAPMVIVVAITGIASFTIPRFNAAITIRMLRFPIMIAASLFGMYGMLIVIMIILAHMANLRSFGVPYLSPTAPLSSGDMKDVLLRSPWWSLKQRPSFYPALDTKRMSDQLSKEIVEQEGQKGKNIPHDEPEGQKAT